MESSTKSKNGISSNPINFLSSYLIDKITIGSPLFWIMHSLYWSTLALASFLTLNLWYGTGAWYDVAHTLVQSLIGFILVLPLHSLYIKIWHKSFLYRLASSSLALVFLATVWTIIRMWVFIFMTPADDDLWNEFGGWYFSGIFIFLGWTAFYYGVVYYELVQSEREKRLAVASTVRLEKLKRLEAEKSASDAKLQMLRYQLNPHFLFNTLNAISAFITVDEANNAKEMIHRLSHFLRYSLEDSSIEAIPLHQDIDALKLYVAIEEVRFSDRLKIIFDVEPEALNVKVPSMILQPIVENSLKYGVSQDKRFSLITISAKVIEQRLCLTVRDDGPGLSKVNSEFSNFESHSGVGLKNTKARLKAFYDDDYFFEIENISPSGALVTLLLPMH
ncbi:MAG: histidine kinase [Pseudomonadales bacterium]|nr:histidine kinase [Pseudomonadales bacterium]